uniref:Cadherin domain-containing protein n=1 Tax=Poecilia reticulata TaxID=8081 RepID=A0A3P9NPY2_POERE
KIWCCLLGTHQLNSCLGIQLSASDILLRQKRNWVIETFTFDEGYSGAYPLYLGRVNIKLTEIHGPGVDKEPLNLLKIDNKTAEIWVMQPVDREKHDQFKLIFQAYKKEKGDINVEMGINVDIIDTNDNEPKFNNDMYEVTIEEAPSQGTELINVTATDRDSTEKNRKFSFSIESVSPTPQNFEFVINEEPDSGNGTISFKGCLDHEKAQKYTLIVKATDHGQPKPLSSSTTVIINIEDGNRHRPVFTKQKVRLQGVLISRLQVTDEDTRGTKAWKAKYKIQGDTNNNFRIDTDPETNEGLLYVQKVACKSSFTLLIQRAFENIYFAQETGD